LELVEENMSREYIKHKSLLKDYKDYEFNYVLGKENIKEYNSKFKSGIKTA
jgi:hypothetical protein